MASSTNTTFDAMGQTITVIMADGFTPVSVSLSDIDKWAIYDGGVAIVYASQLGAYFVMFFIVLILTKSTKRRTPIYILNVLSLFFGFLRFLLKCFYFTGTWIKIYPSTTGDYSVVPSGAVATAVAATIPPLLENCTVFASLILQAYTVCKNMGNAWRYGITIVATLLVTLALAFRFMEMVTNAISIVNATEYISKEWITIGTLVTYTLSIAFFCVIFTSKLVYTLYVRRRNGWKQWSGVRILASLGACTMIVPKYVQVYEFPEAGTLSLTMVALLLPFSSLWAGAAIEEETSELNFTQSASLPADSFRRGSDTNNYGPNKPCSSQFSHHSGPCGAYDGDRKGSTAPIAPMGVDSRIEYAPAEMEECRDSTEIDLEAMGVRIDRSYSIHSGTRK